jgi:hypothetical protein
LTHNKNVAAYQARLQQQQQSRMKSMSMSTGSDRETSSVGSLSPTMTHIQNQPINASCFSDQQSPTNVFTYSYSPSNSPINILTDITPISPSPIIQQSAMFVKPKFIDQTVHINVMKQIPEDRLPVFNQISSSIDNPMSTLTI